jgi:ATP:cob(I)alamin adenosyltransferase
MVLLNKIYTRSGDAGRTRLASGESVSKTSPRVDAYGGVDELNAVLGLARRETIGDRELDPILARIQNELFDLGADLATPANARAGDTALRITAGQVARLESEIDGLNAGLGPLTSFVLPGGSAPTGRAPGRRLRRGGVGRRPRRSDSLPQPVVGPAVCRRPLRQRQGGGRRALGAGRHPLRRSRGRQRGAGEGPAVCQQPDRDRCQALAVAWIPPGADPLAPFRGPYIDDVVCRHPRGGDDEEAEDDEFGERDPGGHEAVLTKVARNGKVLARPLRRLHCTGKALLATAATAGRGPGELNQGMRREETVRA